jgi:hypothetical protein
MKFLALELVKNVLNKETGLFVFQSKDGGVVRVFMVNGKIYRVDGTYGEGKNELAKLFVWEGDVYKKQLPSDFKPEKEIPLDGFYKIIIWKANESKEETKFDIKFDGLLQKIRNSFPLVDFEIPKGLWLSLGEVLDIVRKYTRYDVVITTDDFIVFYDEGEIKGIYSRDGFIDFQKAQKLSKDNFYDWKVYVFPDEKFKEIYSNLMDSET